MPETTVRGDIGGHQFELSTGKLALQANGAVVAKLGGTTMLVTATANKWMREGIDFFPLTVDFEERMYSVGKIPGSFFRREAPIGAGHPHLPSIDRPLRPLFADGYRHETHVAATLAVDQRSCSTWSPQRRLTALMVMVCCSRPVGVSASPEGQWIRSPIRPQRSVFSWSWPAGATPRQIDIIMVEWLHEEGLRLIAAGDRPSDEDAVAEGGESSSTSPSSSTCRTSWSPRPVRRVRVDSAVDYTDDITSAPRSSPRQRRQVIQIAAKQERAAEEEALAATIAEMGVPKTTPRPHPGEAGSSRPSRRQPLGHRARHPLREASA